MRRLFILTMPVVIYTSIFSCKPKKTFSTNQNEQTDLRQNSAGTIFGIYHVGVSGKIAIILQKDSTAVMDNPVMSKNKFAPRIGNFTFRNDSIFISWDNGRLVSSRFERGEGIYSFRIGSTTYKRKL